MIRQIIGIAFVLLVFLDVYLTVLFPYTGKYVISLLLSKATWAFFRYVTRLFPRSKRGILSHCGPTLLVVIVIFWISLFAFGFALIIWPALGSGIQASQSETPTNFATALYYSGFTLTTLGAGDLSPTADIRLCIGHCWRTKS